MAVPSAVAGLLRRPARLGDEVYSAIFSRIMALEIAPGARISVDALARELGVSQTPIREALTRLESEGLVVKTHLVGYSAAPQLSAGQFNDLYELRMQLEPFAAAKAAQLMPEAVMGQLAGLCADMSALAHNEGLGAYAQFAQLDMAFHDQIAASAGNRLVLEALARLHTHVHLFRLVFNARVTADALEEHNNIVAAIRRRDSLAAQAAMTAHIEASRMRFAARYQQ
ncbi:MAG: Transcriptional regulator, GntR family [Devosia sp.]|uniref:GntR family transcriptional regulator n=1 Tax=Devosia sp. TaxID=1871048 RepID=UPI00262BE350|nr:GntR family transcriptional regulator [Devosia sp.]MDB5536412.1 Transcriptional regulator, GntR family [Devosia sp.]MDB5587326.1 Transcriptional regulator, GntR family [Devosia sp.]